MIFPGMGRNKDRTLLLLITCAMVLIVIVSAFFSPNESVDDPSPTSFSTNSSGARAAFEVLAALGYRVQHWEHSETGLSKVDADATMLVLAEPNVAALEEQQIAVADYLKRGGRVLATGSMGAEFLPEATIKDKSKVVYGSLCYTTPEGQSQLAKAGSVAIGVEAQWDVSDPRVRVAQLCGSDAVVVTYPVGAGQVIWWSSARPLTNSGLKQESNLRLLLASTGGTGREVLFDENIHGLGDDPIDVTKGAPIFALTMQLLAIGLLLVISFSRRNGPALDLAAAPRGSPIEFAASMGALYNKAAASRVAIDGATRRLMYFLEHAGGIPRKTLTEGPTAIANAVGQRFAIDKSTLLHDLTTVVEKRDTTLKPRSVLKLVTALDEHRQRLQASLRNTHRKIERN